VSRASSIAFGGALFVACLVVLAVYLGSGGLARFDSPLAAYAAATVFAAFAIVYRYLMWLQRPPTWRYFKASWGLFLRPTRLPSNVLKLVRLVFDNIIAQKFIERRGSARWIGHMCLAWG